MTEKIKLRWLIAHSPAYLFVRTAEAFAAELEKECPGEFDVEILTMTDYIRKYDDIPEMRLRPAPVPGIEEGPATRNPSNIYTDGEWADNRTTWTSIFDGMRDGKITMCQTQITVLGGFLYRPLHALDLPFLFESHDHLDKALESEVGEELLEGMGEVTGIRGLGFTYSGGYRVIGSNHPITSLDDLKKTDLITVKLTRDFFRGFAKSAESRRSKTIEEIAMTALGDGAVETTYLRFSGKHVLKTNHSMFMTSILVDDAFLSTLTDKQRAVFRKAAKHAAKVERVWSVEDAEKYEQNAETNGVTIHELTDEELNALRSNTAEQYEIAYQEIPGSRRLVQKIRSMA